MNDTPPDAFATLNALIALATNPSATQTRLEQLRKVIDKVEASEQRLAQRSAKHDEKVARDRAELEERERKVRSRELAVHDRESRLAADQQLVEKARADMRARGQEHFFNGMVREPEHFGR